MILDGKTLAQNIKDLLKLKIAGKMHFRKPKLVILVSTLDSASQMYVTNKIKACSYVGMLCEVYAINNYDNLGAVKFIDSLNRNSEVDGIIVQLPVAEHLKPSLLLDAIDVNKDVDGLTSKNLGLLMEGRPKFTPCTPMGIIQLLDVYGLNVFGANCVVVGRSTIVGKPLAQLLTNLHATVTLCHSHTRDLPAVMKRAEFIFSAVGKPGFIKPSDIEFDATLIDIGINRDAEGKLCGDFDRLCYDKALNYTPVPGGVGQMTVASLLLNTYASYTKQIRGDFDASNNTL